VDVKQERVTERDANNCNSVDNSQHSYPVVDIQAEEPMQRNDEIATVPPAHAEREGHQHALNRAQPASPRNELKSHPQRQDCANRVADEL
jgi:hypothetical protein